MSRTLINGAPAGVISVRDRGLMYGDGLFETIRFMNGTAPLWPRHMQRLEQSCGRLSMTFPSPTQLGDEAAEVARGLPQAVVRITITRGSGERGYRPPASPQITRVVAGFVAPPLTDEIYANGVRTRVCQLQLAEQVLLAGMKHLNRLEQVLARAEWSDPSIDEGVLCNAQGQVISATMANLFAQVDGQWLTPALDRCGVAGVARAEVLACRPQIRVGELTLVALKRASEVFLSSSVRGIIPVKSLENSVYQPGEMTRQLRQLWHGMGFTMGQVE